MTHTPLTSTFRVGDRIAYAKLFLRNLRTPATDSAWRRTGRVVELRNNDQELVFVEWDDEPGEKKMVHNTAIAKVGSLRYAEDV